MGNAFEPSLYRVAVDVAQLMPDLVSDSCLPALGGHG
jgi:hypothetical protein